MGLFQLGGCTLQHHGARAGWRVQVAQGYAVAGFIWLFTIYLVFLLQDALSGKCCHPAETQPGPFDKGVIAHRVCFRISLQLRWVEIKLGVQVFGARLGTRQEMRDEHPLLQARTLFQCCAEL